MDSQQSASLASPIFFCNGRTISHPIDSRPALVSVSSKYRRPVCSRAAPHAVVKIKMRYVLVSGGVISGELYPIHFVFSPKKKFKKNMLPLNANAGSLHSRPPPHYRERDLVTNSRPAGVGKGIIASSTGLVRSLKPGNSTYGLGEKNI